MLLNDHRQKRADLKVGPYIGIGMKLLWNGTSHWLSTGGFPGLVGVCFLCFDLVVDFFMPITFVATGESFTANVTMVRFFASVRSGVCPEVVTAGKSALAFGAQEWLIT